MKPHISVVIRSYNEEQYIGRLLSGILQQDVADVEIILVDSGSTDSTVAIASHFPVTIVTIRPEDFSFGSSLNIGCRAAHGEFIVIASAHVYPVYIDWISSLLAPFADPRVALTYGKQRGNEETKYAEHRIFARWFPDESCVDQPHPFCNNANAAIRRRVWESLPYDETLTGLEDIDWGRRAMAQSYRIAYVAEAEIVHIHNETPRRIYKRYQREAIALKRIFPHEQFRRRDFVRLLVANVLGDYANALHDGVLLRHMREIFVFRLMQFLGTYRGFAQHGPVTSQIKRTFYYPAERRPIVLSPTAADRQIDYENIARPGR